MVTKMKDGFEKINARAVRDLVKEHINEMENDIKKYNCRFGLEIRKVYKELSIFDWWKNSLSLTDLKNMYSFLNNAIDLGFDGYVCFKVGVTGCANGMWAHKGLSTDGYSPDTDFIFRSFTPEYVEWDGEINGKLLSTKYNKDGFKIRELKKILKGEY